MNSQSGDLERFQEHVDGEALLRFVQSIGRQEEPYRTALRDLKTVLEAVSFGWRPAYDDLDWAALERHADLIADIVEWMAGSPKADMTSAAIELIGRLRWPRFVPVLRRHLSSDEGWQRVVTIVALGRFADEETLEMLRSAAERDPDPEARNAARQQLEARLR